MRRAVTAASIFALLGTSSCSPAGPGSERNGTVDDLRELTLHEELRIGDRDDPDLGFSAIMRVAVDGEGRVYVFEMQQHHFRVYDEDGREVRRFGRSGEGPGEFQVAPSFGIHGNTLWTIQQFPRRITHFDLEGEVLSTGRVEGIAVLLPPPARGTVGLVTPQVMGEDGHFVGHVASWTGGGAYPDAVEPEPAEEGEAARIPRVRFAPDGGIVDTIGWYAYRSQASGRSEVVTAGGTDHLIPPPPSDARLFVPLADGHFFVDRESATDPDSAAMRVTRLTLDGDTVFHRELAYRPKPFGPEQLDALAWRAVQIPRGAIPIVGGVPQPPRMEPDSAERFPRVRAAFDEYPEFQPPVTSHHLGNDERLWLRREDEAGGVRRWLVLQRNGEPLGHVVLASSSRVAWSEGETLWAIEFDELEVPWLVRYRIEGGAHRGDG